MFRRLRKNPRKNVSGYTKNCKSVQKMGKKKKRKMLSPTEYALANLGRTKFPNYNTYKRNYYKRNKKR